jgi:hypothetical protein
MTATNDNNGRDAPIGVSCAVLCRTYKHGKDVRTMGDADRRQK